MLGLGMGIGLSSNRATGGGAAVTYATLDPGSVGGSITFTNGNLTATTVGGSPSGTRSSKSITAGAKVYFEVTIDANNSAPTFGIINGSASYTPNYWFNTASANTAASCPAGTIERYNANTIAIGGAGATVVIGIAYDDTAKRFYTRIGGTWQNSADPVAGTGGLDCTGLAGTLYAAFQGDSGDKATFNFGATSYANTAPTGYGNI